MAAPENEPILPRLNRRRQPGNAVVLGGLLILLGFLGFPLGWHWAASAAAIAMGAFLAFVGNIAWRGKLGKPPGDG